MEVVNIVLSSASDNIQHLGPSIGRIHIEIPGSAYGLTRPVSRGMSWYHLDALPLWQCTPAHPANLLYITWLAPALLPAGSESYTVFSRANKAPQICYG